jgi:hypothetical protein
MVDAALQVQISCYKGEMEKIHNRLFNIPKDLPRSYLEGLYTEGSPPTTTTFGPLNKNTQWKNSYLKIKLDKMRNLQVKLKKKMTNAEIYQIIITVQDKNFLSSFSH